MVLCLLHTLGFTVPYILDDEPNHRTCLNSIPIRGPLSLLPHREDTFAFLAIEDNQQREHAAEHFKHVKWLTLIHPSAFADPSAQVGCGTYIAAGAVVNPGAVIGNHVIVNTGASVGHDCIVEDFAHLESGVRLGGAARVGRWALCRIGSTVVPNCSIGTRATIGPRAVAVGHVPPGATYAGVPAKPAPKTL